MGHGWASDVAHSNIHERYLFTWLFNLYKDTKEWIHHKNAFETHFKIKILVLKARCFRSVIGGIHEISYIKEIFIGNRPN